MSLPPPEVDIFICSKDRHFYVVFDGICTSDRTDPKISGKVKKLTLTPFLSKSNLSTKILNIFFELLRYQLVDIFAFNKKINGRQNPFSIPTLRVSNFQNNFRKTRFFVSFTHFGKKF
jgi:hypothetical protein